MKKRKHRALGKSHRVPESRCPCCEAILTHAVAIGAEWKPEPDSFTLCVDCGELLIFDDGLMLRRPTDRELAALHANFAARQRLDRTRAAWRAVMLREKAARN